MWGKFGQKPNKTQVKEFDDPIKFSQFHDSDKYDFRYVSVLTEQRVKIHYKLQQEDDPVSPNLNIFIACFTTCWARLKLYEGSKQLNFAVLRQNVLDDIQEPLTEGARQTAVIKPYHIVRQAKDYSIQTEEQIKQ